MSATRETTGKPVAGAAGVLRAGSDSLAENPDAERIRQGTADLIEEMEEAIREAGVVAEEPIAPLLVSLKRALAWQGELTAENARVSAEMAREARRVLADARAAADAEIERERAAIAADKVAVVREMALEIAAATRAAQARHTRVVERQSLMAVAGGALAALLVVGGGGYWLGQSSASVTVQVRPDEILAVCKGEAVQVVDGRRVCGAWFLLDQAVPVMPSGRKP